MMRSLFAYLLCLLCLKASAIAGDLRPVLAVVGDQISVATGSDPRLSFDAEVIAKVWAGDLKSSESSMDSRKDLRRIERLGPDISEFRGPLQWMIQRVFELSWALSFDRPGYSWAAMLSPGAKLRISAYWGAGIHSLPAQLARQAKADRQVRAEQLFIFLGHNDVCGWGGGLMTLADDYRRIMLTTTQSYISSRISRYSEDFRVSIVQPISLQQLVINSELLDKVVPAHGTKMSCRELIGKNWQQQDRLGTASDSLEWQALWTALRFPSSQRPLCPLLYSQSSPRRSDDDAISRIAGRLRSYRLANQQVEQELSRWLKSRNWHSRVSVDLLESSALLRLGAHDLANDCHNLSFKGQENLATMIARDIASGQRTK